jgi:threonine dehydratase
VEKCRKFGATVLLHGEHIGEAKEYAQREYAQLKYINGYDDPEIIAGAGTMGIEILEQVNDVDLILVPVGGAGLIAGVSLAVKTIKPHVQVSAVQCSCSMVHGPLDSPDPRSGHLGVAWR